jgi:hypothetical protein
MPPVRRMVLARVAGAVALVAAFAAEGCRSANPVPTVAVEAAASAPAATAPAEAPASIVRPAFAPPAAATQPAGAGITARLQERRSWHFDADALAGAPAVHFDNQFEGGRVNDCRRVGPREFRLVVEPENEPINPSPWYAFRVRADAPVDLRVRIAIATAKSRPRAHLSDDGIDWRRATDDEWQGKSGAPECFLSLRAGPAATWVASQPMIGAARIDAWADALAAWAGGSVRQIGRSVAGRPIRMLEFAEPGAPEDWLVVIGRQHPPEVPGTVGLMRFMETVLGPGEDARRFRARFRIALVPIVNPDGVAEGQWRSTLAAVDPNRDWGPFALQETRAVRDAILAIAARPGARMRLLLDFHATAKDIFYLPPDDAELEPAGFGIAWTDAIQRRFPDYEMERTGSHNLKEWTFKRWAAETFRAPGITYELGYSTPHARIEEIAGGAAEEAMRLLLRGVSARPARHARPAPLLTAA